MSYEKEKAIAIYKKAWEYLHEIKPAEITDEQLDKYFNIKKAFDTKNDIFKRLCNSLQNYQSMPNVIKFGDNIEKFQRILFNFDSDKVLKTYKTHENILDAFIKESIISEDQLSRDNNLPTRYAKAIISASIFMSQFENAVDFDKYVNRFSYNASTAAALPMLLSREIYGMGFALGCDFLKELGYTNYPKPDVHLIKIFSELGLCNNDQFSCYKAIIKMANDVKETPYKTDKVFWLISTGEYYDNKPIKGKPSRDDFIRIAKEL